MAGSFCLHEARLEEKRKLHDFKKKTTQKVI